MPLIVVMDDDAGTRMLVSQVLKKDGYDVLAADNGAGGLRLIQEHKPDLVISDVQMPEMDGFQVIEHVRADAELAATPIILLTSLAERSHMRHGMTSGADDYLTKPFTPAELRSAVNAQLNKMVRADAVRAVSWIVRVGRGHQGSTTATRSRVNPSCHARWRRTGRIEVRGATCPPSDL